MQELQFSCEERERRGAHRVKPGQLQAVCVVVVVVVVVAVVAACVVAKSGATWVNELGQTFDFSRGFLASTASKDLGLNQKFRALAREKLLGVCLPIFAFYC